jgi:hypothetical protein
MGGQNSKPKATNDSKNITTQTSSSVSVQKNNKTRNVKSRALTILPKDKPDEVHVFPRGISIVVKDRFILQQSLTLPDGSSYYSRRDQACVSLFS